MPRNGMSGGRRRVGHGYGRNYGGYGGSNYGYHGISHHGGNRGGIHVGVQGVVHGGIPYHHLTHRQRINHRRPIYASAAYTPEQRREACRMDLIAMILADKIAAGLNTEDPTVQSIGISSLSHHD